MPPPTLGDAKARRQRRERRPQPGPIAQRPRAPGAPGAAAHSSGLEGFSCRPARQSPGAFRLGLVDLPERVFEPSHDGLSPKAARRIFSQALLERHQAAQKVAAVDRRDVGGWQRLERPRVVPVVEMAPVPLQLVERVEGLLQPAAQRSKPEIAEIVGREGREQKSPWLVGEVRCATLPSGSSWKLSGGSQWSSSPTKVSKKCQVRRAIRRSARRSVAGQRARSTGRGRLTQKATSGERARRARKRRPRAPGPPDGPATTRPTPAPGPAPSTSRDEVRRPVPSRCSVGGRGLPLQQFRRVTKSRTSVRTIASTSSRAWSARKTIASRTWPAVGRARCRATACSPPATGSAPHPSSVPTGTTCSSGSASTASADDRPEPGRAGQDRPAEGQHHTGAGGTRLRRRLSRTSSARERQRIRAPRPRASARVGRARAGAASRRGPSGARGAHRRGTGPGSRRTARCR